MLQLEDFPHSMRETIPLLNASDWAISFKLSNWPLDLPARGLVSRQGTNQIFASVYTRIYHPAPSFWILIWIICSRFRVGIRMVSRNQDYGPLVKMAEETVIYFQLTRMEYAGGRGFLRNIQSR
jgi:hypothetical protein